MLLRFWLRTLACVLSIGAFAQHVGEAEAPLAPLGRLKIASLNMQGFDKDGQRFPAMASRIVAEMGGADALPDVFVLQEAMTLGDSSTAHVLAAELKKLGAGDYHVVFKERKNKPGDGPEGVAILSKRPIPADSIKSLDLSSPTPEEIGDARWWPRVALSVEFEAPGLGLVRVVNTHHESHSKGVGTRQRQVAEVQDWIAAQQAQRPAAINVLGGDFNPDVRAPNFRQREFGAITAPQKPEHIAFRDYNSGRGTWKEAAAPEFNERLDYVFVNERPGIHHLGERVVHLKKNGQDLTDHRMLVQIFDWYPAR